MDETSHQHWKQDEKLLMVDGDGKWCVGCVVFFFFFGLFFVGYGLIIIYDQWHLNVFWCLQQVYNVWSKVDMKIFYMDVNEDAMMVEFKKQGHQAF